MKNLQLIGFVACAFFCSIIFTSVSAQENVDCVIPESMNDSLFIYNIGDCFSSSPIFTARDFDDLPINSQILGLNTSEITTPDMDEDAKNNFDKIMTAGFGDKSFEELLECLDFFCSPFAAELNTQYDGLTSSLNDGLTQEEIDDLEVDWDEIPDAYSDPNALLGEIGQILSNMNLDSLLSSNLGIDIPNCDSSIYNQLLGPSLVSNETSSGMQFKKNIEDYFKGVLENELMLNADNFGGDPNWFLGEVQGLGATNNQVSQPQNINDQVQSNVDLYNGKASVSYNLTSIGSKDISVPISIQSSPGGLRVNDQESSIGSGNSINNIGNITRQVNGLPDDFNNKIPALSYGYRRGIQSVTELYNVELGLDVNNSISNPILKKYLCLVLKTIINSIIQNGTTASTLAPSGIDDYYDDIINNTSIIDSSTLSLLKDQIAVDSLVKWLKPKTLLKENIGNLNIKVVYDLNTPNYIKAIATLAIPLGQSPFVFKVGLGLRTGVKIVDQPSPVNMEKEVLGYNYLNTDEVQKFDLEPTFVNNMDEYCSDESILKQKGSKYLLRSNESMKRSDREFFGSSLDGFFNFFKDFNEIFNTSENETLPRYKTQKIDLEPDEYHYSFGGHQGKFVLKLPKNHLESLSENGELAVESGVSIFYSPYQDLKTTIIFEDNKISAFKIRTASGVDYLFDVPEIQEDTYYDLPMFLEYPEIRNGRTQFINPHIATAEYPSYSPFMGFPIMVERKKDYFTNYYVEQKPDWIKSWHVSKIESNLTKEKISVNYETRSTNFNSSKNFNYTYPNFRQNSDHFETKKNPSLNFHDVDTKWNNGFSELHYQVTESTIQKPVIKSITNHRGTSLDFIYQLNENKAMSGDYLLDSVRLNKNSSFYKAWKFKYHTPSFTTVEFDCDNNVSESAATTGLSTFNSASEETFFDINVGINDYDQKFIFYFPVRFFVWCIDYVYPFKLTFDINSKKASYFSNRLSEFGSLKDLKGKLDILDGNESKRFQSEFVRNFLYSVDEIDLLKDSINVLKFTYKGDLASLPKRYSLKQDIWGYHLNEVHQYPFVNLGYENVFGEPTSSNSNNSVKHFGFSANGSNLGTFRQVNSSLADSKIGQIDSVLFETGAFLVFDYDRHIYPLIKHMNKSNKDPLKGGLRIAHMIKGSNSGQTQITRFQYEDPTIVNFPYFHIQENNSRYFEDLETKITTSTSPLTPWHMNKNGYVGYKYVSEVYPNNGYVKHHFTNPDEEGYQPEKFLPYKYSLKYRRLLNFGIWDKVFPEIKNIEALDHRINYEPRNWRLGLKKTSKIFNNDTTLLQQDSISYSFHTMLPLLRGFDYPSVKMYQTNHYGTVAEIALTGMLYSIVDGLTSMSSSIWMQFLRYLFRAVRPVHPYKYIVKDFVVNYNKVYSEVVHVDYQKTTTYWDNLNSSSITTNTYDVNYKDKITRTNIVFSDQNTLQTNYYYPHNPNFSGFKPENTNALKSIHYRQPIHVEKRLNGEKYEVNISDYSLVGDKFLIKRNWALIGNEIRLTGKFDDFDLDLGLAKSYSKAQYGSGTDPNTYTFLPEMTFTWNPQMQLTSRTFELKKSSFDYDGLGRLIQETDLNGLTQNYMYDSRHRVSETKNHDESQITTTEYISNPPEIKSTVTFTDGTTSQTTVKKTDGWGNELSTARGSDGSQTILSTNTYDNMFRVTDTYHYQKGNTNYTFDDAPIGRLRSTIDANGNEVSMEYLGSNTNGFTGIKTTDPNGSISISYKNSLGNVSFTQSGEENKTEYSYDNRNRLTSIKNAIGETFSYQYNTYSGMLASKSVPNRGNEEFWYDKNYQLVATKDGNGNKIIADYDIFGRPLTTSKSNANLSNSVTRPPFAVDSINTYTLYHLSENTYMTDKMWLDSTKSNIIKNDAISGHVFSNFTYDNLGRVEITNAEYLVDGITSNKINNIKYNDAGLIEKNTSNLNHNSIDYTIVNNFTFDNLLRPTSTLLTYDGETKTVEEIIYLPNDLIEKKYVGGNSDSILQEVNYSYDDMGQLISINEPATTNCFDKVELCHFLYTSNEYIFQKTTLLGVTINGIHYECPEGVIGLVYDNQEIFENWVNQVIQEQGFHGSFSFNLQRHNGFFPDQIEMSLNLSDIETFIVHISIWNAPNFILEKKECCERTILNPNKPLERGGDLFFETISYDGYNIDQIDLGVNCTFGLLENSYLYDKDHRITSMSSHLTQDQFYPDAFSTDYSYDPVGNIKTLKRRGYVDTTETFELIDSLHFSYGFGSSKLNTVTDLIQDQTHRKIGFGALSETSGYGYDGMGNMISNGNSGVTGGSFNIFNMPDTIRMDTGNVVYFYSSDQRKLLSKQQSNDGLKTHRYIDEFQFRDGELYMISIPNGRIIPSPQTNENRYQYHLTDHLGNVVVTFEDKNGNFKIEEYDDDPEVLQRNVYYPFGMEISHPSLKDTADTEQDLKYNGKESQQDFSLNYLDYHARQYDPVIGRFGGVDPLADKFAGLSPYNYTLNNPIRLVDPDGKAPQDIIIIGSKEYQQQVMSAIWSLATRSEAGFQLVQNAIDSDRNLVIFDANSNLSNGINNFSDDYSTLAFDIGQATINLDKANGANGAPLEQNIESSLAHELAHFENKLGHKPRSVLINNKGYSSGILSDEPYAVEMENRVRADFGLGKRTHYGGLYVAGNEAVATGTNPYAYILKPHGKRYSSSGKSYAGSNYLFRNVRLKSEYRKNYLIAGRGIDGYLKSGANLKQIRLYNGNR